MPSSGMPILLSDISFTQWGTMSNALRRSMSAVMSGLPLVMESSKASIYLAGILENNRRTQREVADVAGVTEVTIRNRFKEMCGVLGLNPDSPCDPISE